MTVDLKSQKARGAFFTPPSISKFLVEWAVRTAKDRVLEPSCGDAAILLPAGLRLSKLGAKDLPEQLRGIDIHQPSVEAAHALLADEGLNARIDCSDFFDVSPEPRFDAVVGNPPYVRYQEFSGSARSKGLRAALANGVRLTSLASSWAAFTVHASSFLRDEGRLALVLPAELLSVSYASQVRRFLLGRFATVKLILFEELVFPGVLEDVVLLLAEGRGRADHFEVYQVRNADELPALEASLPYGFTPLDDEKWTPALIPSEALKVYREITGSPEFVRLVDWGEIYLGAVTGNNKFFTLTPDELRKAGLNSNEVLRISPPGSRHLRGLSFSSRAWEQLCRENARCFLFSPKGRPSKAAAEYIARGQRLGVDTAYKCSVRAPWWSVPLVDQPDLFFTYMNHDGPRLIANDAQAQILNSLYGVTLKKGVKELGRSSLPIASLNTVTLLGSEVVGRAYGGGLLKHEPREADLLPVPSRALLAKAREDLNLLKPQLAGPLRQNDISRAVEMVDAVILKKHLGLQETQISLLQSARAALFNRRRIRGKGIRGEN